MDDSSSSLSLIAGLVLVEILLTLIYAALQNTRQSELQEQAEQGKRAAQTALRILKNPAHLQVTYVLGKTLLHFAIAIISTTWLILPALNGEGLLSLEFSVLAIIFIGMVVFVLGTTVPEAVGSAYSSGMISIAILPFRWLILVLRPLVIVLMAFSTLLARAFGSSGLVNIVTEEEIMTLVDAGHTGGAIEDEEKEMIYSILQLDETLAREMMIPRIDMVALEVNTPVHEAVDIFLDSGYSRVPVYEENIDKIIGLVYAKDVLALLKNGGLKGHKIRDLIRSAYFVPETRPADKLLRDLQTHKIHIAIVVDEYGGTSGLVTIEDILEEIVGDIRDEYDINEEYEYIKNNDNEYIIDAGMDIDDINDLLNSSISSEETDTLGGYIYLHIGRVPIVGEQIETDEVRIRVRSIEGRRIRKVLVERKQVATEQDQDTAIVEPTEAADEQKLSG